MFKTILATATAALIATAIAAPAQALGPFVPPNGISLNGLDSHGSRQAAPSFTVDGIELPAER
ncbi:MAG: hypothetical protein FJX11_06510 [Alphaproteobacteria bacterium]|nr:hypothetical protein [Alphaproteobacteria bacterium]